MGYYSNPTADAAIGALDLRIKKLKKRAEYLRKCKARGQFTPEQEAEAYRVYTGIFRPILDKDLGKQKTSR